MFIYSSRGQVIHLKTVLMGFVKLIDKVCRMETALPAGRRSDL